MPNCSYISTPGHPALPFYTVVIEMNIGLDVESINLSQRTEELPKTYNIMPAPKPTIPDLEGGLTEPDPQIYGLGDLYPSSWYQYRTVIGMDPTTSSIVKFLVITFYPLRYKPSEGKITRTTSADINISYKGVAQTPTQAPVSTNLVIITSTTLQNQANELASFKNSQGWTSEVVTTEWIYNNYPGVDQPEKIRNYIKDKYDSSGTFYYVIFGDSDQVPVRYAYIPDSYDDGGTTDGSVVETDLYYADFEYTWNENGDNKWGDLGAGDQVDGIPNVYVGRLPTSTTSEASILVDKIIAYTQTTQIIKYLLLGTDTFGGQEGEILKDYIADNFVWSNVTIQKLYETHGTLTPDNIKTYINQGVGFVNFAGHGNVNRWYLGAGGSFYDSDASELSNGDLLPIIFVLACLTARWSDYDCIGEALLLNQNGGAIAYCGASRVAWGYGGSYITYGLAGWMDWRFSQVYFSQGERYAGELWAKTITDYATAFDIYTYYGGYGYLDWKHVAMYGTLLGDPSIYVSPQEVQPPKFSDFPHLFIHDGSFTATVAIGANWERGPSAWQAAPAATIDVIGATLIVNSFIPYATSTEANIIFDSECTSSSDWTSQYVQGLSGAATGDLIIVGGPGVNLVWRYYDGPDGGGYVTDLPAIFKYEAAGPYIYVRSTGAEYRISGGWWSGSAVTDYAIIELYRDGRYGDRSVLLVAGISGVASRIAAEWLNDHTLDGTISTYDCQAIILRIEDSDSDQFTRGDQTVTPCYTASAKEIGTNAEPNANGTLLPPLSWTSDFTSVLILPAAIYAYRKKNRLC